MRIVIVGLGGDWEKIKHAWELGEVWAVNDWWWRYPFLHPDRALQLHARLPDNPLPDNPDRWVDWQARFRDMGNRVIVSAYDQRLPEAVVADTDSLERQFGADKFTSSAACAIMIAVHRFAVKEIFLAGFPLRPHEAPEQAPGILRVIQHVENYNVRVGWPWRTKFEDSFVDWRKVSAGEARVWHYWR